MRDQIKARLAEMEQEIEIGERRWHEVEQEQVRLRETLLRMSGAIQVLRELLEASDHPDGTDPEQGSVLPNSDEQTSPFVSTSQSAMPRP
jgi:predicted nuclease with TOPRIM domain